jgi:aspartyl protease family protein
VRQRLVLLLLLGLIIAILIVMARQSGGAIAPLSNRDFSSLGYKIALLVFVSGAVLTLFRERLAEAITAALLWVVVGLFLVIGYSYRLQLHDIADHVMVVLVPGHIFAHGRDVEIYRSASSSDFYIREVRVNEALVPMVLDTGASTIVLTQDDAKAAGLPLALLDYTVSIDTANGRTHAAPLKIKLIAIGDIEEHSVDALVAQAGTLRTSLLGMSFLNRLQSWEVRGTHLVLHGNP